MINFVNKHKAINQLYISDNKKNTIIDKFKKQIISNRDVISKMLHIDITKCNQTTDINKIIELLEEYKNEKVSSYTEKEIVLASYYGTPYITVNLCMQALLQKKAIIIAIEDSMLAVNEMLISIFNKILEEYKVIDLVKLFNLPSNEDINNISKDITSLICIGNSNTYQHYKTMKIENLKFIPFKNMAIYSEDIKYEELQHQLYKYAITNGIEVEVYDDIEIDEFIECMELDDWVDNIVVITQNEETKEKVKGKLQTKKIYVNQNPFKNENFKIMI